MFKKIKNLLQLIRVDYYERRLDSVSKIKYAPDFKYSVNKKKTAQIRIDDYVSKLKEVIRNLEVFNDENELSKFVDEKKEYLFRKWGKYWRKN